MSDTIDVPAGMCDGRCLSAYDIGLSGYGVAISDPWCTIHGSDDAIEQSLVRDVENITGSINKGFNPLAGHRPYSEQLVIAQEALAEFRAERAAASAVGDLTAADI
ncbi:hypothetical protein [Curtobacterium sp. MCSS17_016]|uniref:hypothetical protein n=1 Tax=Curtobacterium sp. MCSS17_016 TaxID=2175644 RepID=UPI000DAAA27D|nr:hypothetical protein [Curtobacterium sp. MCSS17_016]WIE81325.1 hypothetical protein DEJ19_019010 [Curtobacterium sp. MCSS17_016]